MSRPAPFLFGLLAFSMFATGCSTHSERLRDIRELYFAGDATGAQVTIDKYAKKYKREANVLQLDRATVLLSEGSPQEAEKILRCVRDRFDELEGKDIAEGALAMLTDDQHLAYSGEDYEKVLVRTYLALANLLGDGQDAGAYALQVAEKQQQIVETCKETDGANPKQNYKQVAVGAYIQGMLREATHANYDDAARAIEQVCHWEPSFASGQQDLQRVREGRHSAPGNGVVYVFALVGRGPYKEERLEIPTTAALLVADRIVTFTGKHSLPPTVAPIKVPCVVQPINAVRMVRVEVDGAARGRTETITDVGRLAVEQAEAMFPYVLGRAIARRALKKAVVYGAKEAIHTEDNFLAELAFDIGGVVWESAESADTRCWGLLPEKIQVLRLELPAGTHVLSVHPANEAGIVIGPVESTVLQVEDGRNTYVLANFPDVFIAGRIVTSQR